MLESDLYPAVKNYLCRQGYEVKAEVNHCDVVAKRLDEPPVIVELKLKLNLTVLLQAVDRLQLSDNVYIGVPSGCATLKNQRKRIIKLARMLGLGLLTVNVARQTVNVLCDPAPYQPRKRQRRQHRMLAEFEQRVGDPNSGGSSSRIHTITAYRQKAVRIGHYLKTQGKTKASAMAAVLDEPNCRNILYRNVYGWFDGFGKGFYDLSPKGHRELSQWINQNNDLLEDASR